MVDHQHWLDRWREDRIGFHEASVNRHLQHWFPKYAGSGGSRVFVPLCGKALDMLWIARQGFEVLGVELSEIAIEAFFEENQLDCRQSQQGPFRVYETDGIRLLQGDFFDLDAADLTGCELIYDRAALIALEAEDRPAYYDHMLAIMPTACKMLLITLDYDPAEMRGPPFSVPTEEVMRHYQNAFRIETLATENIVDKGPRWRKVGLTALEESVFGLVR